MATKKRVYYYVYGFAWIRISISISKLNAKKPKVVGLIQRSFDSDDWKFRNKCFVGLSGFQTGRLHSYSSKESPSEVKARHPGALGTISSGPGATCSGLRGSRTSSAWGVCIVQMMFIKYKCRAVFSVDLDRRRAQSVCVARRDRYPVQSFRISAGN